MICRRVCPVLHPAGAAHAAEAAHLAAAVGVQTVVRGVDGDVAAGNINVNGLNALVALCNQDGAARDVDGRVGVDAVVPGGNGKGAARNGNVPRRMDAVVPTGDVNGAGLNVEIAVLFCDCNAVISRRDGNVGVLDAKTVVCPNGVCSGLHGDRAAGDDQIVVGGDAVLPAAGDGEAAAAVDGQILVGKDNAVCAVCQGGLRVFRTALEGVLCPLSQGQEDLVRLVNADAGIIRAGDVHAAQKDPDLRGGIGIHNNAAVGEGAGEDIGSAAGDVDITVIEVGAVAGDRAAIAIQRDDSGIGAVPVPVLIVGGEVDRVGVTLCVLVYDGLKAKTGAVHKEYSKQEREHDDNGADPIDMLMR